MVKVFNTGNPQGKTAELLGASLGQGLGTGISTYFANKAIDNVANDKSLADAPLSEKWKKMQQATAQYGEVGQQLLQNRLMAEQQEIQEKQVKKDEKLSNAKGKVLKKILANEPLTPEDESVEFTPQEQFAIGKHKQVVELQGLKNQGKTQPLSTQPVTSDQLAAIDKAHATPGYNDMTETQKHNVLLHSGVSPENADREAKLQSQQATREQQAVESAYKAQQPFIDETTKSYKGFETEMKPRLLQMQNIPDEDLVSPTAAAFLEHLGIPLGALENPASELYNKLSQDLLKGLPETYGSRILKVEVDNFLKTIPTLLNSPDGRRMIASNMLKLGEMKEVYYNEMRREQKNYLDSNKPLPRDFQQRIFDQVKPQINRINSEFVKMSEITSVPKGTVPYFDQNQQIYFVPKEDQDEWAKEFSLRKIW